MPDSGLGGDPASIRAIASWLRTDLAPRVDDCVAATDDLLCRREEVWEDEAARILHVQVSAGARKAHAFAEAIRARARLLDQVADVLARARSQMDEAVGIAEQSDLRVVDGWIMPPLYGDAPNGQPENMSPEALLAYQEGRRPYYDQAQVLVEDAHQIIVDALTGDQSYDWNQLLFVSGDFVKETAGELVARYPETYGSSSGGVLSRLTGQDQVRPPMLMPTGGGLTTRVLRVGGPLLTATGIAYDIASGDPPEKALLVAGVNFGVTGLAAAPVIVLSGPWAWTVLGIAAILGAVAGYGAGWVYDEFEPAREKLRRLSVEMDPGPTELPG